MKKKFKNTKFGKTLKDVGNVVLRFGSGMLLGGVAKPVGGMAKAIVEEVQDNFDSQEGGQGKADWPRLIGMGVTIVGIVLLIFGVIDRETLEYILEIFKEHGE